MEAREVWKSFCGKLRGGTLCPDDFLEDMRPLLSGLLLGEEAQKRRRIFADAPATVYDIDCPKKAIVVLNCPDDSYRFDFIPHEKGYRLAFVECITLPIANITPPYSEFAPLPGKEAAIRCEQAASRTVRQYLRFRELLGKEEAVRQFLDGEGELLAARSWVPFYGDRLAFIAYMAWVAHRINGERVEILSFDLFRSVLRFHGHLWRKVYNLTGHLRRQISYTEYMALFEAVWRDRAEAAGWQISFGYEGEDTKLIFTAE